MKCELDWRAQFCWLLIGLASNYSSANASEQPRTLAFAQRGGVDRAAVTRTADHVGPSTPI